MDWKARAARLKADIPALFLVLKHPKTPLGAKVLAGVAVGYALSPIDLIPDFIPVLGLLDDLLLLPALAALAFWMIPPEVLAECRARAAGLWENGKPKRWYYALPIVAVWLLLLFLVMKAIWF